MGPAGRGRRKLKKSYEYEVRWAGAFSHPEHDTWLTRDQCALPLRKPLSTPQEVAVSWLVLGAFVLLCCAVHLGCGQIMCLWLARCERCNVGVRGVSFWQWRAQADRHGL